MGILIDKNRHPVGVIVFFAGRTVIKPGGFDYTPSSIIFSGVNFPESISALRLKSVEISNPIKKTNHRQLKPDWSDER